MPLMAIGSSLIFDHFLAEPQAESVRVLEETKGTGAVTRVLIESDDGHKTWGTVGVSENIIEASWNALVDSYDYGLAHPPEGDGE
jgi:2-isopropylmalate synthase